MKSKQEWRELMHREFRARLEADSLPPGLEDDLAETWAAAIQADALEAAALDHDASARVQRGRALACDPVETAARSAFLLAEQAFKTAAENVRKLKPEAGK